MFQSITLLLQLTEVFMSIEMLYKNAALKQCTEQRLTTKHRMHAEISSKHTPNLLLLARSNYVYVLSLFVCYEQNFRKDADNLGKRNRQFNV